jgi:hypothetical protein
MGVRERRSVDAETVVRRIRTGHRRFLLEIAGSITSGGRELLLGKG